MLSKPKKILGIVVLSAIVLQVIMHFQLLPYLQRTFMGRLIQAQEEYIKQGGQLAYDSLVVTATGFISVQVTGRHCVFAFPNKKVAFSAPEICVSWTISRPSKLRIRFPEGGVCDILRLGSFRVGKKTLLTLPISWKNMRPQVASLFSGSNYASTDQIQTTLSEGGIITFKGQDCFLALRQQQKTVTSANGTTGKEPILSAELSIKQLGSYIGAFPIFECLSDIDVHVFLTHPRVLLSGVVPWKEAGGYIECENAAMQIKDLNMSLKGSFTLASTGIPEEGSLVLEINRKKGILADMRNWSPLSSKEIQDTSKCGNQARIPISLQGYNVFVDDVLLFDWQSKSFKDEAIEHVLSELENGKYSF
ncbi:MAG: DUF2125 domain-containing protein [Holosporales bacterium]|jgi:hypothetical protein|nr:DUF2125 domain-containing protein [Holosporales bacterium]